MAETLPAPILPEIVTRYLNGESLQQLATESKVHARTLYRWMLSESGPDYDQLITDCLINRIADSDMQLESATDNCQIARAREQAKFSRMDFERRRPKLYGPKQELDSQTTIQVIIAPITQVNQQVMTAEGRVDRIPLIGRSGLHSEQELAGQDPLGASVGGGGGT